MRDYAKVSPSFWTRGSGKRLRSSADAQVVGLYLMTCPSANMIGLYYLPIPTIAHETGRGIEGASKGLLVCEREGFAYYDAEHEMVYVPNYARIELGPSLKGKDKRMKGVERLLHEAGNHAFVHMFWDEYGEVYGLGPPPPGPKPLRRAFEAPCEPLRSQEQEQEQEQAQEQEQVPSGATPTAALAKRSPKAPSKTAAVWDAYSEAFESRYGVAPVRNAAVNGQLARLVDRVGAEEAPSVARFYLTHNGQWYVTNGHSVAQLLKDAEKLRMEWLRNRPITRGDAREAETMDEFRAQGERVEKLLEGWK